MNLVSRTASVVATAILIVTFAGAWAQAPSKPPKASTQQNSPDSELDAGFITGRNWLITFEHMAPNWIGDTDLANQIGLQEIFHPEDWDTRWMSPSIQVCFTKKDPGVTIPPEMARDAKNLRKQIPDCKVSPGPALAITNGKQGLFRPLLIRTDGTRRFTRMAVRSFS